jgi:hypothetical protein
MKSPSPEMDAARIGNALNDLGHVATGQSLDEVRRSRGDASLREILRESATLLLDMVTREERNNPQVVPRSVDAKVALVQVRELAQSVDWNDATSVGRLAAYARQSLEALGFGLPD